ncbi:MAG: glycosyltransferase family 4 protein [Flavobacteriales bacterium]
MHNIAFYCSSTSWGGLEMNTIRYAIWMREAGHHVKVFCVENSPIHQRASEANLPIQLVSRNRKYFDFINANKVAKLFKKEGITLVWFRDTRDMDLLAWSKIFSGKKWKLLYQQAMQLGVDKKDIFHSFRFRSIDYWVSTLNFLKDQVVLRTKVDPKKISVIPLGVDVEIFNRNISKATSRKNLNLPEEGFIAGIIGRIDPLKGQHTFINAIQLSHNKIHGVVMGESTKNESNQYEVDLKHKVRSLGLNKLIHFKPYSKDVFDFYNAIDVFVLASQGETFGTVTIEAMSFGLPVIGTNSSGTPEILNHGKCGKLFEPDNAQELTEHLLFLQSNPDLMNDLGQKGKKRFTELYSKKASISAIEQLINPDK